MLIIHSLPGEMVYLEKHSATYLAAKKVYVRKGIRQLNFASNLKEFVMSNIIERNKGTGTVCEGAINDRTGVRVGPVRSISCEILHKRSHLRIASLNFGTMRGRASEIVKTLARRRIDICAVTLERLLNTNDYW